MLTVGSLFAGVGGFDLGFERAGMRTLWFAEQDEFCQRVLAKHWPGVPCHPDVRALVADTESKRDTPSGEGGGVAANGHADDAARRRRRVSGVADRPRSEGREGLVPVPVPYVDVLCGGFPCQDISVAGRGEGIDGARSGLWGEYARLVRELRPRYVVVENVAALLARGMERVLGDLAACGYDAEWDCIPASAVGAPHRRDRVWLIAYPQRGELREQSGRLGGQGGASAALAGVDGSTGHVAYASRHLRAGASPAWTERERAGQSGERSGEPAHSPWELEPDVRGVLDGLSEELDGGRVDGRQGNGALVDPRSSTEGSLRDVWQHIATRAASHGRGSDEQLVRELADALPVVPHDVALGEREGALATARAYVHGVRSALSALGAVPDASQPLAPAWVALSAEDQGWVDLAVEGGQWAAEWPRVGRVSRGVPHRVDRLRSLGNALVPQIAEWLGRRIVAYEEEGRLAA